MSRQPREVVRNRDNEEKEGQFTRREWISSGVRLFFTSCDEDVVVGSTSENEGARCLIGLDGVSGRSSQGKIEVQFLLGIGGILSDLILRWGV
jgi:hypothetical protein